MAFRPHPGEFEDEDFSPENDPGGLREYCYTQIKRLAAVATIKRNFTVHEPEEGARAVETSIGYELDLADSDPVVAHLVMQLTRDELRKLLQITKGYQELMAAEIPKSKLSIKGPMPPDMVVSLDTFTSSKMIAALLVDMIEKALVEAEKGDA